LYRRSDPTASPSGLGGTRERRAAPPELAYAVSGGGRFPGAGAEPAVFPIDVIIMWRIVNNLTWCA